MIFTRIISWGEIPEPFFCPYKRKEVSDDRFLVFKKGKRGLRQSLVKADTGTAHGQRGKSGAF